MKLATFTAIQEGHFVRTGKENLAEQHDAVLTVMGNGEHWFHTAEQMRFWDDWIRNNEV